jgi:four helix bundle protein
MAQASLAEVETQLELALRLDYVAEPQLRAILEECGVLGRQLYRLRDALKKRV